MKVSSVRTSSERKDFKRCQRRWFWRWIMGLVPRSRYFGALDFGTWMHVALELRYQSKPMGLYTMASSFELTARADIAEAKRDGRTTDHAVEEAEELISLGNAMAKNYEAKYAKEDQELEFIGTEIPLEFSFAMPGGALVRHKLKADGAYRDPSGDVWAIEHKTAKQVFVDHLPIDDQGVPYASMLEPLLRKAGLLKKGQVFRGIMYNILRKAGGDLRPTNAEGLYLNKDGSVSKSQPSPYFRRIPLVVPRAQRIRTLNRLHDELKKIDAAEYWIRSGGLAPSRLSKTPHSSCPSCPFFEICVAEEKGVNIRPMIEQGFKRVDPYAYHKDSTEESASFEIR